MVDFEVSVDIERPPTEVFAYLTDPANLHEWQSSAIESRQETEGPRGVGTRVVDVRKFLGKKMESVVETTAYDEGKRFDLKVVKGPIPFNIEQRLEPRGETGTRLTVHMSGEPGGFFKYAESMVARQAERQFKTDYGTLKD
ncbi:MAG: SRPBCC family protein, partial [Actinobacteria bacterium]|nr:SRPBCC family protein [Actinomycetota bacterium]